LLSQDPGAKPVPCQSKGKPEGASFFFILKAEIINVKYMPALTSTLSPSSSSFLLNRCHCRRNMWSKDMIQTKGPIGTIFISDIALSHTKQPISVSLTTGTGNWKNGKRESVKRGWGAWLGMFSLLTGCQFDLRDIQSYSSCGRTWKWQFSIFQF
jgi:hypothetical protein